MPDRVQFLTPIGLLKWVLSWRSVDEFTKRLLMLTSVLYGTGVVLKNFDLSHWGIHNLNLARASTILVGALALMLQVALTLLCMGVTWGLRRFVLRNRQGPTVERLLLAINFVLLSAVMIVLVHEINLHLYLKQVPSMLDAGIVLCCLLTALVVALPLYLEAGDGQNGGRSVVIVLCFVGFVYLYYNLGIYGFMPQWIGGGHPSAVRFVVMPDAVKPLQDAGLRVFSGGMTPVVQIVDSDDASYTLYAHKGFRVAKEDLSLYQYSYIVRRDQIQSVIYKPRDWDWNMFADERCWLNQLAKNGAVMGSLTISGGSAAEGTELRSAWGLPAGNRYDGCYTPRLLKSFTDAHPDVRGSWREDVQAKPSQKQTQSKQEHEAVVNIAITLAEKSS